MNKMDKESYDSFKETMDDSQKIEYLKLNFFKYFETYNLFKFIKASGAEAFFECVEKLEKAEYEKIKNDFNFENFIKFLLYFYDKYVCNKNLVLDDVLKEELKLDILIPTYDNFKNVIGLSFSREYSEFNLSSKSSNDKLGKVFYIDISMDSQDSFCSLSLDNKYKKRDVFFKLQNTVCPGYYDYMNLDSLNYILKDPCFEKRMEKLVKQNNKKFYE